MIIKSLMVVKVLGDVRDFCIPSLNFSWVISFLQNPEFTCSYRASKSPIMVRSGL